MIAHNVLAAAAITIVFTKGTLFKALREHGPKLWQELASCALCVGVWLGMFWHLLHAMPDTHTSLTFAADVLASGAMTGVLALAVSLFLSLLDRHS